MASLIDTSPLLRRIHDRIQTLFETAAGGIVISLSRMDIRQGQPRLAGRTMSLAGRPADIGGFFRTFRPEIEVCKLHPSLQRLLALRYCQFQLVFRLLRPSQGLGDAQPGVCEYPPDRAVPGATPPVPPIVFGAAPCAHHRVGGPRHGFRPRFAAA